MKVHKCDRCKLVMKWLEKRLGNLLKDDPKRNVLFSILMGLSAGLPLATDSVALKVAGISMFILIFGSLIIAIISIQQDIKKLDGQIKELTGAIDNVWSDRMGRN